MLGERIVEMLEAEGGLEPDSAVLDIGCGPGRIAAPLRDVFERLMGGRRRGGGGDDDGGVASAA